MRRCAQCAQENPAGFRFCGGCGSELASSSDESAESRRIVSILFCDVVGSTELGERLDPEALRTLLTRYYRRAQSIVERHGGTIRVESEEGKGASFIFTIPASQSEVQAGPRI